ncbi:MAG: hypothetical protein HFI65_10190 [Lachnospiraceae bacterium]|nr:hypothetical protein [Lachnospiraceae bacterium]
MAIALALMAGTVFTALALPEGEEGEEPDSQVTTQTTSSQTTSRETTTSKKPSSSNDDDGDDDDDGSTSGKSSSSSTSKDDENDKTSRVSTSRGHQTSRDEGDDDDAPATSRKQSSSKAGGTLKPDDKETNSEFNDISWGAQYEVETSMPETVSAAKPISKGIDNYYAIALKWIWLPILLICASLFGLIAVNYKAIKEKRLAEQAASRGGRPSDIPMRSGRSDRRAGLDDGFDDDFDDDDIFIPSDTSMRPAPRTGRQPAKRTPPAHRRPNGPRRPRD